MTAFVPISPTGARQILKGTSEVDEGLFMSAFIEAGRIRAYAAAIETLTADGGRTEILDGRIPPVLWRRIVAEGKLEQVLASSSVRLEGDGLVGGRPAVMITGVRFNEANVRLIANQYSPSPPAISAFPPAAFSTKAVKPSAQTSESQPVGTDAPPLIKSAASSAPTARAAKPRGVQRDTAADEIMVSVKRACEILCVGRTKLYELMKTDLEVKMIGRNPKIIMQSVRDYIDRR